MQTGGIRLIVCATVAAAATGLLTPVTPAHAGQTVQRSARPATAHRAAPTVSARAAYLVDTGTGTVHFSKQAARRMPVASLTKIMTAYVVLREAGLNDTVTVNAGDVRHAATNDATSAALRAGERLTVRELLYGAMLPSGADATHALARVYGPGERRFVAKMNAAARSLGLSGTRYGNSDGLPEPSPGYSTAQDQARLAEAALADPVLRTIAATRRYVVRKSKVHRAHVWTNTNKLLGKEPGALGVKTGYTRAAGYCLSFAVDRDGRRMIGVVLGDSSAERRFRTAGRLLKWADDQMAGEGDSREDV
ncbi:MULTISPECIES: D-alanyl-D-alanine carboxypeptidase family protein [Streptosporangium]|uniref:D-alanyl-D-alanine carboxypeptidase (Penicillin-binding protein 5/6) n=1 Tax=Streptosporangium brasiliense TaxID=47480 RepID=A0ABT9R9E1_9ACTN|nr:D-alanyl-D-alanine carboxypeptidase family protein [Streptosporangium brasiliense]MDP9865863.1 D-alanyl-D-alanine carboxypeptidase (penicillin-binding protein 5/6) [Streptosporangium brasiliense]